MGIGCKIYISIFFISIGEHCLSHALSHIGGGSVQLEKDVEGYLTRQVERLDGRCLKFIPDIDNGMPDRLVLLPGGITVWVELKTRLTPFHSPMDCVPLSMDSPPG